MSGIGGSILDEHSALDQEIVLTRYSHLPSQHAFAWPVAPFTQANHLDQQTIVVILYALLLVRRHSKLSTNPFGMEISLKIASGDWLR